MSEQKPLFIPLKSEFYDAFCGGQKRTEYRRYGPRWNENTCSPGRRVVISKGYGKKNRRTGKIVGFTCSWVPCFRHEWTKCFGRGVGPAACIDIQLDRTNGGGDAV